MRSSNATVAGCLVVLALLAGLVASGGAGGLAPGPPAGRIDADSSPAIADDVRARSHVSDPGVPPDVAEWFASAVSRVRPEARRLIDAVDGQVTLGVHPSEGLVAGFVQPTAEGFNLSLAADSLRRYDQEIRDHVIIHELGHVVDLALVPSALNAELDLAVPRIGGCAGAGDDAGCASAEERFADTFAKWALDDPVVLSGIVSVGYRVAPPANLAVWGEPLAQLGG